MIEPRLVAVGRLTKLHDRNAAEFALVVSDSYQRLGLGRYLLEQLMRVGRDEALGQIIGYVQASNRSMLKICQRLGFQAGGDAATRLVTLNIK